MNRIRGGATALCLAAMSVSVVTTVSSTAFAQVTTGRVTGRVTDKDTGAAMAGVTVIVQGAQGEDATITDDKGDYYFLNLPVGTYVIRFYVANTSTQVEQPDVKVAADRLVRVNAKIAGTAQATPQQTYVITGKAPTVDVGSTRVGYTFDGDFARNVPNGNTFGEVIQKAPGTFVDASGNVSIGGATGLENIYSVNGLNVTGLEYGNLESGAASISGGTNLPNEFLTQIDVSAGGYQAEFGGAMGGVISTVLKSGTNQWRGSAFGYWSPYWLSGEPNIVTKLGNSIASQRKPDFNNLVGVEAGGPLIKDKLFLWVGFAPSFQKSHVFRLTYALQDANMDGSPDVDANGNPISKELRDWRARINETHQTWSYAATMDFVPAPDHRLQLSVLGTPSFNEGLRIFNNADAANSNPGWAREALTKTNSDVILHWTSKLFDKRWQLEAFAGLHNEYFNNRSPDNALNGLNQLEYWGANLFDLEGAPGCQTNGVTNPATGLPFQPCPVDNYHAGGFGLVKKFTGQRWTGEVKGTNLIDAGGHHEVKYGWHLELSKFDQDRYYSGPLGSRGLVQLAPNGGPPLGAPFPYFNTYTFFTLQQNEFPSDFGGRQPATNLLYGPDYQDHLEAHVKGVSNAFFLQDSYSPAPLRNLTVNVGARLELQKMYDTYGSAFLDTNNLGPRLGAVYDPMNDGRSKISVSYGRYFEAIPMNLAARYFGGEGILLRNGVPLDQCAQQNPYRWSGSGEWNQCMTPPNYSGPADPTMFPPDNAAGGSSLFNNGRNYPVQAHLKGEFHSEVVATAEREIVEDLTVRLDYIHRWIGNVIEDGTTDPNSFLFVLANPGNVPPEALKEAQDDVTRLQGQVDQMSAGGGMVDPRVASELGNAQAKLTVLRGLAAAPKPERTYDALTVSLNKRFSRQWFARASYTYSRLVGNYEGLYQTVQNYFAPNGNNAYDTPDLYPNQRGRLPNDRPHLARVDGYYTVPIGNKASFVAGLSFSGQSGMPRNYLSALLPGQQLVFLLPRGAGGRTPPVTQFDVKLGYSRELTPKVTMEIFADLFNVLNQQASVLVDDNYTYDLAAPIVNGTPDDLKFAKNGGGAPINKNPNYGRAIGYQAPFHARLGARLNF